MNFIPKPILCDTSVSLPIKFIKSDNTSFIPDFSDKSTFRIPASRSVSSDNGATGFINDENLSAIAPFLIFNADNFIISQVST